MSAMASQITNFTIVYSTVYSRRRSKNASKLRITGLCVGNSPVTGEFPVQRASNAEIDDGIMYILSALGPPRSGAPLLMSVRCMPQHKQPWLSLVTISTQTLLDLAATFCRFSGLYIKSLTGMSSTTGRTAVPNRKFRPNSKFNALRLRQIGRHLKCLFLKENFWVSIKMSLKFVPQGPVNKIPWLVQIMALCRPGDKRLSESIMVKSTDTRMHHSASMS